MKILIALFTTLLATNLFAWPSGYGTKTVYEAFVKGNADIAAIEGRATLLEGRATALEGRATPLEGRATAVEGRATVLEATTIKYKSFTLNVTSTLAAAATVAFADAAIPAGAVIVKSFAQIETQVESADDNTIALACGSAEVLTAADLTNTAAGFITLTITDAATTYKSVGAAVCNPTITIGAGASGVTAGKVKFTIGYIL